MKYILCVSFRLYEAQILGQSEKIYNFFQKGVYKSENIVYNNDIYKGCERKDALSFTYREPCRDVFRVVEARSK